MPWLDRINDRQTRRVVRGLQSQAIQTRDLAQEHLQDFAGQARNIARFAAHQVADYGRDQGSDFVGQARDIARSAAHQVVDYGRHQGADLVRRRADHYAHRAGEVAGQIAEYGRNEGAVLAQAAAVQAVRAGRAMRADPMPVIIGAVGAVLLANLLFGRRR